VNLYLCGVLSAITIASGLRDDREVAGREMSCPAAIGHLAVPGKVLRE
jgi:hypothetical protein